MLKDKSFKRVEIYFVFVFQNKNLNSIMWTGFTSDPDFESFFFLKEHYT